MERNAKRMVTLLLIITISFICNGCARPMGHVIKNNKELAGYLPQIRDDFPMIKEKFETLRQGTLEAEGYTVHKRKAPYAEVYTVELTDGKQWYDFSEYEDQFTQDELDAINYLFFSDDLQFNANSIHSGTGRYSSGAVFVEDGRYAIAIHYYENKTALTVLPDSRDYVEDLGDNYYLLLYYEPIA